MSKTASAPAATSLPGTNIVTSVLQQIATHNQAHGGWDNWRDWDNIGEDWDDWDEWNVHWDKD